MKAIDLLKGMLAIANQSEPLAKLELIEKGDEMMVIWNDEQGDKHPVMRCSGMSSEAQAESIITSLVWSGHYNLHELHKQANLDISMYNL